MGDLSWQEYISYVWENLWFIRPEWLYAFLPIGAIALMFLITYKRRARWKRNFNKKLLPFLTVKGTKRQFFIPKILLILLLSLLTLAAAGPTWEQIERPGQKTEAALVVLLDLSRSMLVEDIQPNRLERAKFKLRDFFMAAPQARTALVAYAGTAHSVVPFSKDYKTIVRQMDALRPDIMPVQGSNLPEGMQLADSLLRDIVAPSTILLVTDNLTQEDVQRIGQTAVHTHVEILAVATPSGGTIPVGNRVLKDKNGNTVIPRLDVIAMDQVDEIENVNVITVTLDDSDVKIAAAHIRQNLEYIIDPENVEEEWKDFGYWLSLPILLIGLFWFRRGWKVQWIWLFLIGLSCNEAGEFKLENQFFTQDQRGQLLLNRGDTLAAAKTFKSANQKGFAYYQMGELDKALEAYSEASTAEGFYNLGVVYAQMGNWEAAQQAFDTSLELDPEFRQAKVNLERVTNTIDSIQTAEALARGESIESEAKPKEFQEYTEVPDEQDKAMQSDEKYEGKGDFQEMVTKEVDENTIDFFEFDENMVIDKDAARQTLLRQITEDPAIFLRRKFAYQNRNRKKPVTKMEEDW